MESSLYNRFAKISRLKFLVPEIETSAQRVPILASIWHLAGAWRPLCTCRHRKNTLLTSPLLLGRPEDVLKKGSDQKLKQAPEKTENRINDTFDHVSSQVFDSRPRARLELTRRRRLFSAARTVGRLYLWAPCVQL